MNNPVLSWKRDSGVNQIEASTSVCMSSTMVVAQSAQVALLVGGGIDDCRRYRPSRSILLFALALLALFVVVQNYRLILLLDERHRTGGSDRSFTFSSSSLSQQQNVGILEPQRLVRNLIHSTSTESMSLLSQSQDKILTNKLSTWQRRRQKQHRVANLSCIQYGGPSDEIASEMIYWKDILMDAQWVSPYRRSSPPTRRGDDRSTTTTSSSSEEKYLTFEPDEAGWNNVRMALETTIALAIAMGRTLVLPPEQKMHMLVVSSDSTGTEEENEQQTNSTNNTTSSNSTMMGFHDFFHLDSVQEEYVGLDIISFQEFLERVAMTGQLIDPTTGEVSFPPENRTNWSGRLANWETAVSGAGQQLWGWIRNVTTRLEWNYTDCVASFPQHNNNNKGQDDHTDTEKDRSRLESYLQVVLEMDEHHYPNTSEELGERWQQRVHSYDDNPTPVNGSATDRLAEILAHRTHLCVYDTQLQSARVVHVSGDESNIRFLIDFYAFIFMEDYHDDLWLKRFVRDHLRYTDEIQCAAARIVHAVRQTATAFGEPNGLYDSFHIRRTDFIDFYQEVVLSAENIYENNTQDILPEKRTIYVATDENDVDFFVPLRRHYHLVFLQDYEYLLTDISPSYYGMIDQLVASKGEIFFGTYLSTFTGYINRLRGYHTQKSKSLRLSHPNGIIDSYHFADGTNDHQRKLMRTCRSVREGFWSQEWPIAWRLIDQDISS